MANKFIAAQLEIARRNESIKTIDDFFRATGRTDLVGHGDELDGGLYGSIVHGVRAILKRRAELADPANYKVVEGRSYFVEPKPKRPEPITEFILEPLKKVWSIDEFKLVDVPGGKFWSYILRPTKGWLRERIDESTAAYRREAHKIPLFRTFPKGRARRVA